MTQRVKSGAAAAPLCVAWFERNTANHIVGDRQWCAITATRSSTEQLEGAWSVKTLCGAFVILNAGLERRLPTCAECLAELGLSR